MGDSDDEYDRKRRDKFRGERDSYRSDRRDDRSKGRDEPYERTRGGRGPPDYRDYRRERNYSPDRPPIKRMRHDWEDMRPRYAPDPYMYGGGGGGGYGGGGHHGDSYHPSMPFGHRPPPGVPHNEPPASADGIPTQPAMMTLKQFLATQDDSISDQDAITKYNEYKVEFRRQQLNEFFVAHKDEEWFKIKYHPEESLKRREEQLEYLKNRVNVFSELLETGDIQKTNVDMPNSEKLIRLLDTVVIKLEGGTEEDLKVLDRKPEPPKVPEVPTPKKEEEKPAEVAVAATEKPETESKDEEVKEKSNDEEAPAAATPKASPKEEKQRRKRKRSNSSDSSSSGSSSSSSSSSSEDEEEKPKSPSVEKEKETPVEVNEEKEPEKEDVEMKEPDEEKKSEGDEVKEDAVDEEVANKSKDEEEGETKADDEEEKRENERERTPPETIDVDQPKEVVRELHRTSSIFLRNLAPTITKAEVEAMCKRYAGFLRVAIADPLVERRWFRRGWVTFQREVNFKEICWNLNNIRLRDCELGAIVNRDLSRRVRPVNGITVHRNVVRSDIKLAAKICHNLDIKAVLWADMNGEAGEKNGTQAAFGFDTKNPVLQNITDYLIEEASAEEDELLGLTKEQGKEGGDGEIIERDAELLGVLDKIILYLRIVHSVDFYNHCEYPYEDEMPNRCGIIHARGPVPQNKVTQNEISEYIRNFEQKMSSFLAKTDELSDEELKKLGTKDADAEVEKFIKANSQELGKDKWLCPLSGKKFKGPDFIRKHIFNKHSEKVEEVRKEVTYFNNYLKDPKRPQLPENPANTRKQAPEGGAHNQPSYRPPPYGVPFGMPYGGYPMMGRGRGGYRGSEFLPPPAVVPADNRRKVVAYNDLDTLAFEDSFI